MIIAKKEGWEILNEDKKPEWLTWEQIKGYENLMSVEV